MKKKEWKARTRHQALVIHAFKGMMAYWKEQAQEAREEAEDLVRTTTELAALVCSQCRKHELQDECLVGAMLSSVLDAKSDGCAESPGRNEDGP